MTSGFPRGSVFLSVLFNVFDGNINRGIEYTLRNFPDDTKLCGEIDTLEGWDTIQRDFGLRDGPV